LVVVQHGWGGGGFARTLHLENSSVAACVVNVPAPHPQAVEWIVAEALAAHEFTEVHFTGDGRRLEPRLKVAEFSPPQIKAEFPAGPEDVLLVTGGGKGIAAECALAFARETGVKLALIGRSDPKSDKELAENLSRMAAAGVRSSRVRRCDGRGSRAGGGRQDRTQSRPGHGDSPRRGSEHAAIDQRAG
jgi:enediyne polyketide synthase